MPYKTIVLELLQAHQGLHNYLRLSRRLTPEMDRYARDLRTTHQHWEDQGLESSAALELALEEITARIAREATRHESAGGV